MRLQLSSVCVQLESAEPLVVRVCGEVDCANAKQVEAEMKSFLGSGCLMTVLADEIGYMDSTGLGVLVNLHKRCLGRGGHFKLVDPAPRLNRVLQITGLGAVLNVESRSGRRELARPGKA